MGPITLFDKSFLQMLKHDEAVLFDNYFTSVLCPTFFVEVLGNLAKDEDGISAESRIKSLSAKSPFQHVYPTVFYQSLIRAELLGTPVDMSMRPHMAGGHAAFGNKGLSVSFDQTPEQIAFHRWQNGEFLELERDFASQWRKVVKGTDLKELAAMLPAARDFIGEVRTLGDARVAAERIASDPSRQWSILRSIVSKSGFGETYLDRVRRKWNGAGNPSIKQFAPYAAFVFEIDIFFEIAVMKSFIDTKMSNAVDFSYLYYLPFCRMFVSQDKLHRKAAPLFMNPEQTFIWGDDLQKDLAALNSLLLELPEEVRNTGLMKFANKPPIDHSGLVATLWDKHYPEWRSKKDVALKPSQEARILREMRENKQLHERTSQRVINRPRDVEPNAVRFERSVPIRSGSWYILPKGYRG